MGNSLEENKGSVSSKMPLEYANEEYWCLAQLALSESYETLNELMKKEEDFHHSFATLLSFPMSHFPMEVPSDSVIFKLAKLLLLLQKKRKMVLHFS